jgi:hypothetical protein
VEKKGLSAVVVTTLVILISLAIIGILTSLALPFLRDNLTKTTTTTVGFTIRLVAVEDSIMVQQPTTPANSHEVRLIIRRDAGAGELAGWAIRLKDINNQEYTTMLFQNTSLLEFESRSAVFNYTLSQNVSLLTIIPIANVNGAQQLISSAARSYGIGANGRFTGIATSQERPMLPVCDDTLDNDNDGFADFPEDAGCADATDASEETECQDNMDNDNDFWEDLRDPACTSTQSLNETSDPVITGQCFDRLDNNNNGLIDGQDPACTNPQDPIEETTTPSCNRQFMFLWQIMPDPAVRNFVNLANAAMTFQTKNIIFGEHQIGIFPRISPTNGQLENGGIPQRINLQAHLTKVENDINTFIPDPNWDGYATIDYESWSPVWNWTGAQYQQESISYYTANHNTAGMSPDQISDAAAAEYNEASKTYWLETIKKAKQVRPMAKWGYYSMPRANYHLTPDHPVGSCQRQSSYGIGYNDCLRNMNDHLDWLWDETDLLQPDIYQVYYTVASNPNYAEYQNSQSENAEFISESVGEAVRIANQYPDGEKLVLPYTWHRYHDSAPMLQRYPGDTPGVNAQFLNALSRQQVFQLTLDAGADGAMLWGWEPTQTNKDAFSTYFTNTWAPFLLNFKQTNSIC